MAAPEARHGWRWKSRRKVGRLPISREVIDLIHRMSRDNLTWGAPRIRSELLLLGYDVAESTLAKYMVRKRNRPRTQGWLTFMRNHLAKTVTCDVFTVPTVSRVTPEATRQRVVGFLRRECLDHVIVFNAGHLRRILTAFFAYYHDSRSHLSLGRNAPTPRDVEPPSKGRFIAIPQVGGLHLRYTRVA